jgi:hypothetical protein
MVRDYSYFNAWMGRRSAAFLAGQNPNKTPIVAVMLVTNAMVETDTTKAQFVAAAAMVVTPTPNATPKVPPIMASKADSTRN